MARVPLSSEEKDSLNDFVIDTPAVNALLKIMDEAVEGIAERVLKLDLADDAAERQLTRLKCRAEGAASLAAAMKQRLATLKAKQKV